MNDRHNGVHERTRESGKGDEIRRTILVDGPGIASRVTVRVTRVTRNGEPGADCVAARLLLAHLLFLSLLSLYLSLFVSFFLGLPTLFIPVSTLLVSASLHRGEIVRETRQRLRQQ